MRKYSFGVFILLLVYTIGEILPENQDNDEFSPIFNDSRDDFSYKSITDGQVDESENHGDVIHDNKTGNQVREEVVYKDGRPVVVSENREPEENLPEDDVAYWESIYGTEDVPEFEIPPDIAGETIFIDLAGPEDRETIAEEDVQVKRTIRKTKSNFMKNSRSVNDRNGESPESYSIPDEHHSADYRSIASGVYQPQFYSRHPARNFKTSSALNRDEDRQFYGSDRYSGTVYSPNIEQRDENIRRSESLDAAETEASHGIDLEMEGEEEESAERVPLALEPRSTKFSDTAASLLDFKRKKIEGKKELVDSLISSKIDAIQGKKESINSFAADIDHIRESFPDSLMDFKRKKYEGKKELVDSLISSKIGAIQGKKESTDSFAADIDHIHEGFSDSLMDFKRKKIEGKKELVDSLISSKIDAIQGKKESIHSFAADIDRIHEGFTDSLMDFKRKKIEGKKELVDSLLSSKIGAIQGKKESVDSFATGIDHTEGCSTTAEIHNSANTHQSRTRTQSSCKSSVHQSVSNSEREIVSAEKDSGIQDVVTGDGQTKSTNEIMRALDAKRERVEPEVSHGERDIHYERELGHDGVEDFGGDSSLYIDYRNRCSTAYVNDKKIAPISRNSRYRDPFQSVLDSKRKVIQAKKDLIHTAATGGSKAEFTCAVVRTLDAKKDLIDSVISSKAEIMENKKQCGHAICYDRKTDAAHAESKGQSSMQNGHCYNGDSRPCSRCQKCSKTSTNLRSGSKSSQHRHESVVNSKVTKIQSSQSSHHRSSSLIGTGNLAVTGEIRATEELRDIDHDSENDSSTLEKKVEIDGQISADLDSSLNIHQSGVGSSYSSRTDDSGETKINNDMKTIHQIKSSHDATVDETAFEDEIRENYELSDSDEEQDTALNVNERIEGGGQISTHQESSLSESQSGGKLSTSSIRVHSANTKSGKVKSFTQVKTIHNSQSSLITSQSGVDSSANSDRINLDARKEEKKGFAAVPDSEAAHVSYEENPEVISSSIESNQEDEEKEGISESSYAELRDTECMPEKCGISGKLYIDSDNTDENINLHKNVASVTITDSKPIDNVDINDHKEDEKIIEVEIRPSVTKESQIVATEDEKVGEDENEKYNEETTETDEQPVINEKLTKTITVTKKVAVSDDSVSKSIVIETHNPETILTKFSDNNEGIQEDEFEEVNGEHHEWEETNSGHLSHQHLHENSEYYGNSGILFNDGDCRLINLDLNCSGITAFTNPECRQLNTNLWHPQDSSVPITLRTVKTYLNHGQELAIEMQNRAKWLCEKGYIPKPHTPAMLHLINNLATETTVEINYASEHSLFGTKLLQSTCFADYDVTPNSFLEFLKHHSFRVVGDGLRCNARPKRCQGDQIYRSFDGSCNNREHPTWGRVNTAFSRILPARYSDGIHELPKSVTGNELPNPRVISVHCFSRRSIYDKKLTLAAVQWGQILSHDFAMQIPDQTVKGGIICCADEKRQLPKSLQHHSCLPIVIPSNDKFYSKFGARCMEFARSMTVSREDCTLGPAEQLNTVTSYLDVSPLYGSNKETCDRLRAFEGGRMLVSIRQGRELMPTITNRSRFCDVMSPSEVCYSAGDIRANQTPQLAILQTVLLREHNRIADRLTVLNPHWSDEQVFQETRRIILAEYQSITYNEWLPLIIGKKYSHKYKITSKFHRGQISRDYDPRMKASIINEFTTTAYRFFHSMVQGHTDLCPMNRDIIKTLRLSNYYFRPQIIERNDNLDDLLRGLVTQPMQKSDENFDPEITEYLFRSKNPFGFDLLTLDIQRGRDHGMPRYNDLRKICGLKYAKDFDALEKEIPLENIEKLKRVYADVNDIDAVVGIGLEKPCTGSILGPVARCLVGEQFHRSRIGDRYFYDNPDQPYPFTQEQLNEIRKASFAKLLCNTADNLENIQPEAFKLISPSNPLMFCSDLPDIDLSAWQEIKCN